MVSFIIKGWLVGPTRLSGLMVKCCAPYECCIETSVNGQRIMPLLDSHRLMHWFPIFYQLEHQPNSTLMIRISGDREWELAGKMIDSLMNYEIANNRFMLIFPNRGLRQAVDDAADSYFAAEGHALGYEQDLLRLVCPEESYPCFSDEEF